MQNKSVQIPYELFFQLLQYFLMDNYDGEEIIRLGLEKKLDAMVNREVYSKYQSDLGGAMMEKDNDVVTTDKSFFENISNVLANARKNAKTAVNLSMVYAYYEVGRMIVEEEQHGENRAMYGKYLLKELSEYLSEKYGKGFSVTNLKQMRQFYLVYATDQISQTLSDQFKNLPAVSTGRKFFLSWSHYLKLMRITNIDERHFYEIESVKNDWSLIAIYIWMSLFHICMSILFHM